MAVVVIDAFEMVEIENTDRKNPVFFIGANLFLVQAAHDEAAIIGPGQFIALGLVGGGFDGALEALILPAELLLEAADVIAEIGAPQDHHRQNGIT